MRIGSRRPGRGLLLGACAVALAGLAAGQDGAGEGVRGVFSQAEGDAAPRFVRWTADDGERAVQSELDRLRDAGGGILRFTPGVYELETGFAIQDATSIRVVGTAGTVLRFAPAPERSPVLASGVARGDAAIELGEGPTVVPGRRYQVYPASLEGDRILEFVAADVDGTTVRLQRPAHYMGHVTEIPAGSVVLPELNAFRLHRSSKIVFEGLTLDGRKRGDVSGHTTFCGIYAVGSPDGAEFEPTVGLTVRGCTIRDFSGRGVCVYRTKDVLVESCTVDGIRAEAIEIDHFSSGRIVGNDVRCSRSGIVLNDAYASTVEKNVLSDCRVGVAFIAHYEAPGLNTGSVVQDNVFRRMKGTGVAFRTGIEGNVVRRNRFADMPERRWFRNAEGNALADNAALDRDD